MIQTVPVLAVAAASNQSHTSATRLLGVLIVLLIIGLILHRIVVPLIRGTIRLLEKTIEFGIKIGIGLTVIGGIGVVVAIMFAAHIVGGKS